MKHIGIIGCGWLGWHIANHLKTGYKIYTTTTSPEKRDKLINEGFLVDVRQFPDQQILPNSETWQFLQCLDVIIITVPFPKNSAIHHLENRFRNLLNFIRGYEKQLFLMSSIGIYPQVEREIKENTFAEGQLEPTLLMVEKFMRTNFPQVNILRLGGLMGKNRIFSNYKVQMPDQIVNHVHYHDICLVLEKMILNKLEGKTYNVVAPLHPTKIEVISYQKGISEKIAASDKSNGRKILSDLLQQELEYEFKNPDPRKFM